ncbi:hypothetical protein AXF42_Ash009915 [Apostasia shenzhenica]|uniref:Uncharacterized protein n=1 Tax=Apostasia shenzhenica TaxID=1088818 RepID=A0A2I0ACE0_9ASPA|nr:hypothetical protein AXF42_Ash009915 [Apostasia shenzhenica]
MSPAHQHQLLQRGAAGQRLQITCLRLFAAVEDERRSVLGAPRQTDYEVKRPHYSLMVRAENLGKDEGAMPEGWPSE